MCGGSAGRDAYHATSCAPLLELAGRVPHREKKYNNLIVGQAVDCQAVS